MFLFALKEESHVGKVVRDVGYWKTYGYQDPVWNVDDSWNLEVYLHAFFVMLIDWGRQICLIHHEELHDVVLHWRIPEVLVGISFAFGYLHHLF